MSITKTVNDNNMERRKFIGTVGKATGLALALSGPVAGIATRVFQSDKSWTVGEIINLFINEVPGAPFKNTVDTLKSGNPDIVVTGIVTTMFATVEVINKAISLGANFIIAHEPSFYNHADETDWLKDDDVYHYKAELLKKHNIAIWRNHDYIHSLPVDGVTKGVVSKMGWQKYFNVKSPHILNVPAITIRELITDAKHKLGISMVRYIGDLRQSCQKILLMPGAAGGTRQIQSISKEQPDVLICGEIHEWETAEYVRDARAEGKKLSLVVLGHIASEEPGSEFMREWIKEKIPGMKVTHIHPENSLMFF